MATPSVQTEDIAWAIKDALITNIGPALNAVQTRRTRDPILLVPPVSITFGVDDDVLDRGASSFPTIAIIAAPRIADPGDQRYASVQHAVLVEWYVLGETFEEATIMQWRYSEAVMDVLLDNAPYIGFDLMSIAPQIAEGQATPHGGGPNNRKPIGWVSAGQVTLPLLGRYTQ